MTETQDADQAREELKRFGVRLRDRRILAKLSRRTVAEWSSMSDCTIKFIESARTRPKLETIVALMRVPELGLQLEDLPSLLREREMCIRDSCLTEQFHKLIELVIAYHLSQLSVLR